MSLPPSPFPHKPNLSLSLKLLPAMLNFGSEGTALTSHKLLSAKLPILKSPGPDLNYLDWEMVVTAFVEAAGLEYIIEKPCLDVLSDACISDNKIVCALIMQALKPSNLRHVCENCQYAHGMWLALNKAHQDQTTGGRVYWL